MYDSAQGQTLLHSLDLIQNSALRICCGAMKSTPIAAMQVECDVMPLELHRLALQVKFAIKVKATHGHVAERMFQNHWTDAYCKRKKETFGNRVPLAVKTEDYFNQLLVGIGQTASPKWAERPPWLARMPVIDTGLTNEVSKHDAPDMLAALTRLKIESYSDHDVHIYTDASRDTAGQLGIGFMLQTVAAQVALHFENNKRITDEVSVFTGKLTAIALAVQQFVELAPKEGWRSVAIFSDSLSTIQCFRRGRCVSRPNLFDQVATLLCSTEAKVMLVWVPSHIGVPGNERADLLAQRSEIETTPVKVGRSLHSSRPVYY